MTDTRGGRLPLPLTSAPPGAQRRSLLHSISLLEKAWTRTTDEREQALLERARRTIVETLDVYDSDPTLPACPAGREEMFALAEEPVVNLLQLVDSAQRRRGRRPEQDPVPAEEYWTRAGAVADRLRKLRDLCKTVARPDHDSVRGSRRISGMWLEASGPGLVEACEQIADLLAPALELEHVDPRALRLRDLVTRMREEAQPLAVDRAERVTRWDADRDVERERYEGALTKELRRLERVKA